ncbi:putative transcription factor bHLH family [Helianthus annuus]|nr:putative transcription factor bHLH family [Helianthus annuus]
MVLLKMHTSSMLKKEFLNKWIKGLQICCSSKSKMDLLERKKKIKLSADIAMASAKKTATSWSNALISEAKKNKQDTILVSQLLGSESPLKLQKSTNRIISIHKRVQCKKILKRSCYNAGKRMMMKKKNLGISRSNFATTIAKRLVKKRTKVLKRLVPGGESMDEVSLIKEAMDYILSLKVQVDVMRSVVTAAEVLSDDKLLKLVE